MSSERDERRAFPTDRELSRMALAEDAILSGMRARITLEEAAKYKALGAISGRMPPWPDSSDGNENFEVHNPHD